MKIFTFSLYVFLLFCISSCVKVSLYEPEQPDPNPEPENTGKVVLTIAWNEMDSIDISDKLMLIIGKDTFELHYEEQLDTLNMEAGTYGLTVYNIPGLISVADGVANVKQDTTGYISYKPGIFYSVCKDFTVTAGEITKTTIIPLQRTGKLYISFNVIGVGSVYPSNMVILSGELTNIAGAYDIKNDRETNPSTVNLKFSENNKCTANIFGLIEGEQEIILTVTSSAALEVLPMRGKMNVSEQLKKFNSNKINGDTILLIYEYMQFDDSLGWQK